MICRIPISNISANFNRGKILDIESISDCLRILIFGTTSIINDKLYYSEITCVKILKKKYKENNI